MPLHPKPIPTKARVAGFTLIELMVVVLVAAILVGIAVPGYQSQIRHSRRTDAKTAVLDAASREEKYLTLGNTYTTTAASLGYSSLPIQVGSLYYTLNVCVSATAITVATPCTGVTGTTGTYFVVSAIPVTGKSQASDSTCLYYAVDNTGAQFSASTTAGTGTSTASTCWQ
jgi:type IV pilus assembly protein PilE